MILDNDNGFKKLNYSENDVFEIDDNTYKIAKFKKSLHQSFNSSLAYTLEQELGNRTIDISLNDQVFSAGIDCHILTLGSDAWKKRKLKFKVSFEFYIEDNLETTNSKSSELVEPESPLDDLRYIINQENS